MEQGATQAALGTCTESGAGQPAWGPSGDLWVLSLVQDCILTVLLHHEAHRERRYHSGHYPTYTKTGLSEVTELRNVGNIRRVHSVNYHQQVSTSSENRITY